MSTQSLGSVGSSAPTPDEVGSPHLMRRINRQRVLVALRDNGPSSRPALSTLTGLSKFTVNVVANELLAEDRLNEMPGSTSGSRGPRARVLAFNASWAHVAAVDVGAAGMRFALADLAGRVVFQQKSPLRGVGQSPITGQIEGMFHEAIRHMQLDASDVRALCIATPGVVDPSTQRVRLAPQLPGWDAVDPVAELRRLGDFPVVVENEVRLAVTGERLEGAAVGVDDVAYFHLGIGVGLGLVIDGRPVHGALGAAGEIGYLPIGSDSDERPPQSGRFEWAVGGDAYRRVAAARVRPGSFAPPSTDHDRLDQNPPDAAFLYERAIAGDAAAIESIDAILESTAQGVAAVCTVVNPAVVIIGGGIAQAGTFMLDRLAAKVRAILPVVPDFRLAGLRDDAALVGAIHRALDACSPDVLR